MGPRRAGGTRRFGPLLLLKAPHVGPHYEQKITQQQLDDLQEPQQH